MGVYLDYNASTPIDERVLTEMIDVYRNHFGNADSRTHQFGSDTKHIVERSRQEVADLLAVPKETVYFTSGSTESNNLALLGLEAYGRIAGKKHIITSAIEHKSILEPCKELESRGFEVEYVYPHEDGRIHVEEIIERLREDTLLVSVMHVNNETGMIQPVKELGEKLKNREVYFHVDASQSCGKLVREIQDMSYDLMSLSAHKMYGPQGVGALIVKNKNGKRSEIRPIMYGGGQERGLRPGTLPVALICGLGAAARILRKENDENRKKCELNRNMILKMLKNSEIQYQINGDPIYSIDSTLNISFNNYDSEALMLALQNEMGISNGSACTSHNYTPSYVLQAMGLDRKRIESAVRISWGKERIDAKAISKLIEVVAEWQK